MLGLAGFFVAALLVPASIEWGVISFAAVMGVAVVGLWLFGRRTSSALHLTLIASLAALATAGRVLFASIANFQPVTFLVLASGIALGPGTGFMVGATSALVSNFFFGQGPWTPWQMVAWGAVGLIGGLMGRSRVLSGRTAMIVVGALLSVAFDWFVTIYMYLEFTAHSWPALVALYAQGLAFDAMHAFSTALFAALFGRQAVAILRRFKQRMLVSFVSEEESASL
jgi:energy-coupling factor transport system substrate-specific component